MVRNAIVLTGLIFSAFVAEPQAATAQIWQADSAFSGSATAPTVNPPYSLYSRPAGVSGACNTGTMTPMSTPITQGAIGGRQIGGLGAPAFIAANFSNDPNTMGGGVHIPMLHLVANPGSGQQCLMLRLTIPAGSNGVYAISSGAMGAYFQFNSFFNTNVPTPRAGDGVRFHVFHNGVPLAGSGGSTQSGFGVQIIASRYLNAGDTLDFAIAGGPNSVDDTTVFGLHISRQQSAGDGIEIMMSGTPNSPRSNCCAPWGGIDINPALTPVFPNGAGGSYTRMFDQTLPVNAALNAQMSAYLNYLHALNPAVTTLTMTWQAANLGTGPTASTSGTTIGEPQTITWTWAPNGATMSIPGGTFWNGSPFPLTSWIGFQTTCSVNGGAAGAAMLSSECRNSWTAWRAQPQQIVQAGAPGGNGRIVFESIDARGRVSRTRPVNVQPGMAYGVDGQVIDRGRGRARN